MGYNEHSVDERLAALEQRVDDLETHATAAAAAAPQSEPDEQPSQANDPMGATPPDPAEAEAEAVA